MAPFILSFSKSSIVLLSVVGDGDSSSIFLFKGFLLSDFSCVKNAKLPQSLQSIKIKHHK
jgi:hypothetical protein